MEICKPNDVYVTVAPIGLPGPGDEGFGVDGLIIIIDSSAPTGSFSQYHVEMDYQHDGVDQRDSWDVPREATGLPYNDYVQIPRQRGTEPRGSMKALRVRVTKEETN